MLYIKHTPSFHNIQRGVNAAMSREAILLVDDEKEIIELIEIYLK